MAPVNIFLVSNNGFLVLFKLFKLLSVETGIFIVSYILRCLKWLPLLIFLTIK